MKKKKKKKREGWFWFEREWFLQGKKLEGKP